MTETKVTYIAQSWIGTDPPCKPGEIITPEQLKQIDDIRKYVYLGQIQTKTATKRTRKNKEAK
jgi:hypothetical protein